MKRTSIGLGSLATLLLSMSAYSADIPLYSTGPAQDSAFLRFVNASDSALDLVADGAKASVKLEGVQTSNYMPVTGGQPIKGTLARDGSSAKLNVSVAPGEFATVIALPDASHGIKQVVVREQPDDFNGLKASLAFISVDPGCANASLRPAGRNADLFTNVADGTLQRRSINPVKLAVQLVCANGNVGAPVDLGELKAGERYSVLLLPSATGPRLLSATDRVSN